METKSALFSSLLLALYCVTGLWGFWTGGVYALGVNYTVFLLLFLSVVLKVAKTKEQAQSIGLIWIAPIVAIAISYSLYENPFLKVTSLLVFPSALAVFCLLGTKAERWRPFETLALIVTGPFLWLTQLVSAVALQVELIRGLTDKVVVKGNLAFRLIMALLSSALVLGLVVFPLLSSADALFALRIDWIHNTFIRPLLLLIPDQLAPRIITFVISTIVILGTLLKFMKQSRDGSISTSSDEKLFDPIIIGTLIGSVLVSYLLFVGVQIERLWLDTLPLDFKTTERMVKTGFWQLLGLTSLNIIAIINVFGRSSRPVNGLLAAFTFASALLLLSAGQRLYLYVTLYGLSYEKFFASYAVLYCVFGFIILSRLFVLKRAANVIRSLTIALLWMYSLATLLPVELIIFKVNLSLAQQVGSRVRLSELVMLSSDVAGVLLPQVKRPTYLECLSLKQEDFYVNFYLCPNREKGWNVWLHWLRRNQSRLDRKLWYEHSVSSVLSLDSMQKLASFENWITNPHTSQP